MPRQFRILVVDDEVDLRELTAEALRSFGFQSCCAEGAYAAIKILDESKVDAIVSDMKMPLGSGLDLLIELQKRKSEIPVFIMTGYADFRPAELKQLGAMAVFSKPFDIDELFAQLSQALQTKPSSGF